jgi:hypothetical protein
MLLAPQWDRNALVRGWPSTSFCGAHVTTCSGHTLRDQTQGFLFTVVAEALPCALAADESADCGAEQRRQELCDCSRGSSLRRPAADVRRLLTGGEQAS